VNVFLEEVNKKTSLVAPKSALDSWTVKDFFLSARLFVAGPITERPSHAIHTQFFF